jgi:hypothetical protein
MGDWELKALQRTGGFCRERLVGVDRHLEKTYKSISYISYTHTNTYIYIKSHNHKNLNDTYTLGREFPFILLNI